jgi:hypothetical protein
MTAAKFTNAEKADEAEREVKMRKDVYTRAARGPVMSSLQLRRLDIMQEIAAEYRNLAQGEKLL